MPTPVNMLKQDPAGQSIKKPEQTDSSVTLLVLLLGAGVFMLSLVGVVVMYEWMSSSEANDAHGAAANAAITTQTRP